MGLWDLITAGPKIEEIKMAFVGKYAFDRLEEPQRIRVEDLVKKRFSEAYRHLEFDSECERTRYIFYALAMWELGINHGITGYQWYYVKRPAMTAIIDERLWETTQRIMKKDYGIQMNIPKK